jgi:hypothetical protein
MALGMLGVMLGALERVRLASEAEAALICQQRRKPLAHLRVKACKKKESAVFDTIAESARLDALEARSTEAVQTLGVSCQADSGRRLLTAERDLTALITLGQFGGSLCRMLDDDLAACAEAYEVAFYGATACAAIHGKCMPCLQQFDVLGFCRNTCQPQLACTSDPGRTVGLTDCSQATTPEACARSWSTTNDYAIPTDIIRTASCFWDATSVPAACRQCTPVETSRGRCANSCIRAADMPRCRIGGRSYGSCPALNGNAAACALTYEMSLVGTLTCWYDAGSGACNGCDPLDESQGLCTNGC